MQIVRMQPLWPLFDFELYPLAFLERSVTLHIDRREMDEYVLLAVIWGYESVAFRIVEPLYDTGRHNHSSKNVCTSSGAPSFPGTTFGRLAGRVMNLCTKFEYIYTTKMVKQPPMLFIIVPNKQILKQLV